MIDYLAGIAKQVLNQTSDVRPTLRSPFDIPPAETTDFPLAESIFPDESIQVTSPVPSEVDTSQPVQETSVVSTDDPASPAEPQPAMPLPTPRKSTNIDQPAVQDTPRKSIPDAPIELVDLQNPLPTASRQQTESPPPVSMFEKNQGEAQLSKAPTAQIRIDDEQIDTRAPRQMIHPSGNHLESRSSMSKTGLPVHVRITESKDKSAPRDLVSDKPPLEKPATNKTPEKPGEGQFSVEKRLINREALNDLQKPDTQKKNCTSEVVSRSITSILSPQLSAPAPLLSQSVQSELTGSYVVSQVNETTVHVNIGRVVVRANVNQGKPAAARQSASRHTSQNLEDYLRGGAAGRLT